MLVQYVSKLVVFGLRTRDPSSTVAIRVLNLSGPVSDFRILLRYYGLLPLAQWIIASEQNPDPNLLLRSLTRLQNLVNVIYYPLEHTYWLALHNVVPISAETRDKIGMWSCRFWSEFVI